MRDAAGSAAAPAARCRNCRRGSFILNLPSRHSITSSARAMSASGAAAERREVYPFQLPFLCEQDKDWIMDAPLSRASTGPSWPAGSPRVPERAR